MTLTKENINDVFERPGAVVERLHRDKHKKAIIQSVNADVKITRDTKRRLKKVWW